MPEQTIHAIAITGPQGHGHTVVARQIAKIVGGPFRAPHHTVSRAGITSELALAAGGVLYLDEVHEFSLSALGTVASIWERMDARVRPVLVFGYMGGAEFAAPIGARSDRRPMGERMAQRPLDAICGDRRLRPYRRLNVTTVALHRALSDFADGVWSGSVSQPVAQEAANRAVTALARYDESTSWARHGAPDDAGSHTLHEFGANLDVYRGIDGALVVHVGTSKTMGENSEGPRPLRVYINDGPCYVNPPLSS